MTRMLIFLVASLASIFLPSPRAVSQESEPSKEALRQNIVLIVVDDQGLDAGAYGNPVIQTPAFDALASDGMRFEYAFATTASCSASRSVILTGLHNHRNGQYGHEHSYHGFETHKRLPDGPE